jgi:sarcosine oxidase, subunit beta
VPAVFPCPNPAKIVIIGEEMTCQTADIIIIGGGITGCCLAYELKKKSFSVILLEKNTIGAASSGRSGGGVRQQNRVPQELALAMLSVKVWHSMAEELDTDVEYRQNGNLKLILAENETKHYKKEVERQRRAGLDVSFLNEKQVRELLPVLSCDIEIFGGTYCPGDGTANPLLVTKAIAAKARKLGADIHEHESVTSVTQKNSTSEKTTIRVKTKTGSYESPVVINAAGVWSGDICNMLGMHISCEIKRSHILVTQAISPVIKPFVSHPKGYMRQAVNGNLHLGVSSQPVLGYDTSTDIKIFEKIAGYYIKLFPFMEHLPIIRTWAGLTYWTRDAFPIIGRAPGLEGFYLAAGFSGHGFCLGPGAARVLSQTINGEEPDVDLEYFSCNRFLTEKD